MYRKFANLRSLDWSWTFSLFIFLARLQISCHCLSAIYIYIYIWSSNHVDFFVAKRPKTIQYMDPYSNASFWGQFEPHHSQKRPSLSDDEEENLQVWDPGSLLYTSWAQNQPGISSGVIPNQTNGSRAQASQPPNTSNASVLKKSLSSLSGTERALAKRKIDQAYRERCKNLKQQMQLNLENLSRENESLKKENESLKKDNASTNQTLRVQAKEIDRLRSDLLQLKREHEKQNVLLQTLSGLLVDPVRLENEKLKDENASLRKNANLNSNLPQLVEENAKLKIENKVLKVQNDALCGKIISDNDKKREQEP